MGADVLPQLCSMHFCMLFALCHHLGSFTQHCKPSVVLKEYVTVMIYRPPKGWTSLDEGSVSPHDRGHHLPYFAASYPHLPRANNRVIGCL